MTNKMPDTWSSADKTLKAVQLAFEMEQHVAASIREKALSSGLTPSDQIRKIIGLPYSPPKRPRLTVSLSPSDYQILAEKYHLDPSDIIAIKRMIMEMLIAHVDDKG